MILVQACAGLPSVSVLEALAISAMALDLPSALTAGAWYSATRAAGTRAASMAEARNDVQRFRMVFYRSNEAGRRASRTRACQGAE